MSLSMMKNCYSNTFSIHRGDTEIASMLKKIEIIIDTREQANKHITEFLTKKKVPFVSRKLDVGDYSAQIGVMSLEKSIVIERKGSLDEVAGNIGTGRERFEKEFLRAKAGNTKVYLVIEDGSWEAIKAHRYRSELSSKAYIATLRSWMAKYDFNLIFCEKANAPEHIYETLLYHAREALK